MHCNGDEQRKGEKEKNREGQIRERKRERNVFVLTSKKIRADSTGCEKFVSMNEKVEKVASASETYRQAW